MQPNVEQYGLKMDNKNSSVGTYFDIPIGEYFFTDKIADIYSSAEGVRQWFIKQLTTVLGYPISLIQIEHIKKMENMSDMVFMDIVVFPSNNYSEDNPIAPVIVIGVKAHNSGVEDALIQLKKYMRVHKECEYGVVTDGNSIVVLDKNLNLVNDIPNYSDLGLDNRNVYEYEYINLIENRKNVIIVDSTAENSIELLTQRDKRKMSDDEIVKIPVFTNIAAGNPMYIDETFEGRMPIPKELIGSGNNCFVLKVKGESMINAGIEDGDHVIIRNQPTANVNDIVAADIDGEATLKRFAKKAGQILLKPENPEYEPILLKPSQVRIIGVAVGVLKGFEME